MNYETYTHTGGGPTTLTVVNCWDDLRYLIMRTVRFGAMVGFEVGMLAFMWFGLRSLGMGAMKAMSASPLRLTDADAAHFYWRIAFDNPWVCVVFSLAAFAGCVAMWFAVGVPYSYQTAAPGVNARLCDKCETVIPDRVACQKCGKIRIQWFVTKLLLVLGAVVTAAHFVNDMTIMLVSWAMMASNRK